MKSILIMAFSFGWDLFWPVFCKSGFYCGQSFGPPKVLDNPETTSGLSISVEDTITYTRSSSNFPLFFSRYFNQNCISEPHSLSVSIRGNFVNVLGLHVWCMKWRGKPEMATTAVQLQIGWFYNAFYSIIVGVFLLHVWHDTICSRQLSKDGVCSDCRCLNTYALLKTSWTST